MSIYYLDSSALVKIYMKETGSSWMRQLYTSDRAEILCTSVLSRVEVVSALARRMRMQELDGDEFDDLCTQFNEDFAVYFAPIAVSDDVIALADSLLRKYSLRSYDALHIASAKKMRQLLRSEFSAVRFISADVHLNSAALSERFAVDNPTDHPATDDVDTPPAR